MLGVARVSWTADPGSIRFASPPRRRSRDFEQRRQPLTSRPTHIVTMP
jgi:hypothetical protein